MQHATSPCKENYNKTRPQTNNTMTPAHARTTPERKKYDGTQTQNIMSRSPARPAPLVQSPGRRRPSRARHCPARHPFVRAPTVCPCCQARPPQPQSRSCPPCRRHGRHLCHGRLRQLRPRCGRRRNCFPPPPAAQPLPPSSSLAAAAAGWGGSRLNAAGAIAPAIAMATGRPAGRAHSKRWPPPAPPPHGRTRHRDARAVRRRQPITAAPGRT